MYRILLAASRICLVAFLLGGVVVTLGQATGIAAGSGALMEVFGTTVADTACIVAGVAGILAFLLLYTKQGRGTVDDD